MFRIQAQGISKRFNREWIFKDLTYTFTSGNIYAVTGPNGSGKSTLLQVLCGQMPLSQGKLDYYLTDQPIDPDQIYRYITMAAPYLDLIDEFTLEEQVRFHFTSKSLCHDLTESKLLETMYLETEKNKYLVNFSSGMKQRVKLALALYSNSPVVFLDEPGTNLDKQAFTWYLDSLKQAIPGKLIFIASNQPAEYPDKSVMIDISDYKYQGEAQPRRK
jgi:ABC-type multidrug transport system ATPase subunit